MTSSAVESRCANVRCGILAFAVRVLRYAQPRNDAQVFSARITLIAAIICMPGVP